MFGVNTIRMCAFIFTIHYISVYAVQRQGSSEARLLYSIMPCRLYVYLTGYLYGSICVVLGRKKSHHGLNEEMFCWFHSFHSIPGFTIALYLQTEQTFVLVVSLVTGDWWLWSPTMYDPCLCLPHTAIALCILLTPPLWLHLWSEPLAQPVMKTQPLYCMGHSRWDQHEKWTTPSDFSDNWYMCWEC